jgi:hypothetical protein
MAVVDFKTMQKTYAIVGALFIPMLAIVLLVLNSSGRRVGDQYKNSLATKLVLGGALLLSLFVGALQFQRVFFPTQ